MKNQNRMGKNFWGNRQRPESILLETTLWMTATNENTG